MRDEICFRAGPHATAQIIQCHQGLKQLRRIIFRAFHRQHGGQIVNRHHIQHRIRRHPQRRRVPCGGPIINRHRVVITVRITGHIANRRQLPCRAQRLLRHKNRSAGPRKNTVQKQIMRQNFRERPARGGLCHIPFGHITAHRRQQICRPGAHTAQRPDHNRRGARRAQRIQLRAKICQQRLFATINPNRAANFATLLRRPALERHRRPGITGPIAKSGHTTPGLIHQIFKVIQCAATSLKTLEQRNTRVLSFESMAKHDVAMRQRRAVFWQLFKAEDNGVLGGLRPAVLRGNLTACGFVTLNPDCTN